MRVLFIGKTLKINEFRERERAGLFLVKLEIEEAS